MDSDYANPSTVPGSGKVGGNLTVEANAGTATANINAISFPTGAIIGTDNGTIWYGPPVDSINTGNFTDNAIQGTALGSQGNYFFVDKNGNLVLHTSSVNALFFPLAGASRCSQMFGLNSAGLGITPVRGLDDRQDVVATDGAPITVYAVPATADGKFRITATVTGASGTVSSAIYTIKYTVDGVVVTHTVTISAVDTDATYTGIVNVDKSTNITAQLTTLTGASASVDLACLVEAISLAL